VKRSLHVLNANARFYQQETIAGPALKQSKLHPHRRYYC
jgi:hypothetical protein